MAPRSVFLAAGLMLLACTQELPLEVPAGPTGPVLAAASRGVVERSTVVNGYVVNDVDAGLQSTIGFDRARWCADGAPGGGEILDYLTEHDRQVTHHPDGRVTEVYHLEGILVVSEGNVFDCGHPVLGYGSGRMERTLVRLAVGRPAPQTPPNIHENAWHGSITTADGSVRHVSVRQWNLTGWRKLNESFRMIQARIILR